MKVKIKMPLSYYITISGFLKDLDASGFVISGKDAITNQVLSQSLKELNKMLLDVVYLNSNENQRKMITKSFLASYGLNFFGLFYGSSIDGYSKVPVKDMCRQLEEQLFISGLFKLPSYVINS